MVFGGCLSSYLCLGLGELTKMLVAVEFDDGCGRGCIGCRLQISHFCDGCSLWWCAVLHRLSSHHSSEEVTRCQHGGIIVPRLWEV